MKRASKNKHLHQPAGRILRRRRVSLETEWSFGRVKDAVHQKEHAPARKTVLET